MGPCCGGDARMVGVADITAQGAGPARCLSMRSPCTARAFGTPVRDARHRRPLKVGIQLPEVEREVRWPELLDMTRAIEDLGFDSVWVGEHLLYRWADRPPRGPWEAWTLLAAIAASTSRIELGPLVACTNFHNPALLAKQAATIDEISGGRFVLGLGAGWNETEFRAFGYPVRPPHRPLRGGVHDHPDAPARRAPSTSTGAGTRPATASCCRAGRDRPDRR